MRRIKLPVVRKKQVVFPEKALCPWCHKQKVYEPHSMAVLNAGAMRLVGKDRYEMADDTAAFLMLSWHGAHSGGRGILPEVYASVSVADEVASGQFDLYFCSTTCLRSFLNYCVDSLEKKMRLAHARNRRASFRTAQRRRDHKSTGR